MASIIKRGKVLTAMWRADGKQYCKSTKSEDKKEAQKIADGYEQASRNNVAAKQQYKVLGDMLSQKGEFTSTQKYIADWLKAKQHETAPGTMRFYEIRWCRAEHLRLRSCKRF